MLTTSKMLTNKILCTFLLATTLTVVIGKYTRSTVETLIADKSSGYNKLVMDVTEGLVLNIGFDLLTLRYIHEVEEKMSVVGSLDLSWTDNRLAWNTSDYEGIQSIMVENNLFWTPLVIHANSFDKIEKVGFEEYWLMRIYNSGKVFFFPAQVFTSTCSIDLTLFPLDKQTCQIQFVTYGYMTSEMYFKAKSPEVTYDYFQENGVWKLESSAVTTSLGGLSAEFHLTFSRRSIVIILNVILPIIFLSFLNCLTFLIPSDSGEKISYSMTILLAITVFLTLVSDHMPQSAESVAVLCYYLAAVLGSAVFTMIGTIFSVRISHRSVEQKIGCGWTSLVTCLCIQSKQVKISVPARNPTKLQKITCEKFREKITQKPHIKYLQNEFFGETETSGINIIAAPGSTSEKVRTNGSATDVDEINTVAWKDVSLAFDRVLFYISLVASMFFVTFYAAYIALNRT